MIIRFICIYVAIERYSFRFFSFFFHFVCNKLNVRRTRLAFTIRIIITAIIINITTTKQPLIRHAPKTKKRYRKSGSMATLNKSKLLRMFHSLVLYFPFCFIPIFRVQSTDHILRIYSFFSCFCLSLFWNMM